MSTSITSERLSRSVRRLGQLAVLDSVFSLHTAKAGCVINRVLASVWTITGSMLIIGTVAAYDIYLTLKYAATLHLLEANPLGRWMMALDCGPVCDLQQIAAFITAKFVGTLIVLMTVHLLAHWRLNLANTVALTLATFQLWLAYHLTFAM